MKMRTVRIYEPISMRAGQTVLLSRMASQHVATVLRMRVEDKLVLFSGDGQEYDGKIIDIQKKQVWVKIETVRIQNRESPRAIHLAQAIAKGDRMDWIIQKAVELGVYSITPIMTKYTVIKRDVKGLEKKVQHWEAIAIAACEQCGRNTLPVIHPVCDFHEYVRTCNAALKLLFSPFSEECWRKLTTPLKGNVVALIGPEGGFCPEEIESAFRVGFRGITLGPRILRSDTAAITALSLLQALYGDL